MYSNILYVIKIDGSDARQTSHQHPAMDARPAVDSPEFATPAAFQRAPKLDSSVAEANAVRVCFDVLRALAAFGGLAHV